jgi:hypothetical protein
VGGRPAHVINAVLPTGEQKFDQASASLRNPDLVRLGKRFVAADADAILASLPPVASAITARWSMPTAGRRKRQSGICAQKRCAPDAG